MHHIIDMQQAVYRYLPHSPDVPPVTAVAGMTLAIPQGAFWVVLGRNGSGKSTLSRLMNALLIPKEGTVIVDGFSTHDGEHLWEIRRTVGVVFQNPDNQIVATTVEEDVAFGPENLGVPQAEIRQRVDDALETVSMTEYLTHSPHMLSGGQKQRVAIAGILAMKPKCIVLDEATSMLDPEGRSEVLGAIRSLHAAHGMTVVLITHHMEEAVGADHVLVMQAGAELASGTPQAVFQQPELLREAGLDVPQVTAFGEALRTRGLHAGSLPVTTGDADALMDRLFAAMPAPGGREPLQGTVSAPVEPASVVPSGALDFNFSSETLFGAHDFNSPSGTQQDQPAAETPLIRVTDLRHVYMPGTLYERTAVDGISLTIRRGEFLGIIGHTGSGKSTFVQHLNGLLKATSGTLEVDGLPVDAKSLKLLRRKVGLIFQYPEHQLFEETVEKDIAYGLVQMGLPADETARRVAWAAQQLSIPESLLHKSPFELSGGQKRRVAIAGVLAMQPEILILDEPTAGLDPRGSREVFGLLTDLNRREGTTIVLISHNMEDMAAHADRVAVLRNGRLALEGTPRAVFARQDALRGMHLDAPAITRLFHDASVRHGRPMPTVLTVEEAAELVEACMKGGVGA